MHSSTYEKVQLISMGKLCLGSRSLLGTMPSLRHHVRDNTIWLLPSYLHRVLSGDAGPLMSGIHPTSYLDGFRGIFAFLVFVRHFALPWQPDIDYGYLHGEGHDGVLRLPILRLLYAGPNVPVFIVVSGFVMSLKPLKLVRSGQWDALYKSLASSVFRRAIRLFTPPAISTFLVACAVQLGFVNFPYGTMPGMTPRYPPRFPSVWLQFENWANFVFTELTYPWTWKSPPGLLYGAHLWTTPLQFRCSLVLILVLLALGKSKPVVRRYVCSALVIYCFSTRRWDVALYTAGLVLADYHLDRITVTETLPKWNPSRTYYVSKIFQPLLRILIILLGLYMSSFPRQIRKGSAPGFEILYALSHDYHQWHALGALLLVWSLSLNKTTQRVFNSTVPRYLGKLSFSLYIVHEPLLHVFGFRCVELAWRLTGNDEPWRYQLGFLLGFVMTTPVVLWCADVFQRAVDEPCARFSSWVERRCSVKP